MVDTLYDGHYKSREKLALVFAEILNEEARAIADAGVATVQFDEPAFNVYFDEVRDWGVAALERAAKGLSCTTAVHICYGYGIKANNDWKKTLGDQWRQYEQTFPLLAKSSIGQVSLECANSHVPLELIGLLAGKDVLVGAIDVATDRIETADDVAATIRAALAYVPAERLFPCTNCGMVPLAREVARASLRRWPPAPPWCAGNFPPPNRVPSRGNPSDEQGIPKCPTLAYAPKGVLFQVLKHVQARSQP
jgi:5-methyltetrahydropteroyltriglutamate--homocysteine methyltransferase